MRVGTEKSMNNTKKLRSALLSSLTIIASIVLGHTAQAASLYFEPLGTQLEVNGGIFGLDGILDISVTANQPIKFKIFINTPPLFDVKKLNYKVEYDTRELQFIGIAMGTPVNQRGNVEILPPTTIASFTVSNLNALNIAPNQKRVHITTIEFFTTGQLRNDGIFDFKISGAGGRHQLVFPGFAEQDIDIAGFTYGTNNNNNALSQEVEVQTPEPTSILGLFSLGIIGAGATIKREVKRNHSIEKETTEIG